MKRKIAGSWCWLAVVIASMSLPAQALPKAAENENAPVTFGAEASRPKITAPVKKPAPPKAADKARGHKAPAHPHTAKAKQRH